ncbi:glycosyltransferase family 2 protein [bacterium]|nr:glycosyltransferase family 2 protein [bacterium]
MPKPKITVLMPVYNCYKYIGCAVESILGQTYRDFEFLIIDDGSNDCTLDIVKRLQNRDPRIRLIRNEREKGVAGALNTGIDKAQGEFIARMDGDDISLPDRFKLQSDFLDRNSDVGVCGSWVIQIGCQPNRIIRYPGGNEEIVARLLFESVIAHPAVMMRRDLFDSGIRYNTEARHAEDYDLWVRCRTSTRFHNIQKALLLYRRHQENISNRCIHPQIEYSNRIRYDQLKNLGFSPSREEMIIHDSISNGAYEKGEDYIKSAQNWLIKLYRVNNETSVYDRKTFTDFLIKKWFEIAFYNNEGVIRALKTFLGSSLFKSVSRSKFKGFMLVMERTFEDVSDRLYTLIHCHQSKRTIYAKKIFFDNPNM